MMEHLEYQNDIHLVLKDLIDRKSKRDHLNFTLSQLAKALRMPHSILSKLTHEDPSRRVNNPRLDTLCKIVHFFKNDGFDITIDDLLQGLDKKRVIPLYFLDSELNNKIGTVEVDIATDARNLLAFVSDEYIEPMFKKGSIFIVDTLAKPTHHTLVAIQMQGYEKILIRKLFIHKHKKELRVHDNDPSPISLMPTQQYRVVGVVIQVNAKT